MLRELLVAARTSKAGNVAAARRMTRYIATPTVAKHRLFVWLDARACPDHQLIVIARDDDTTFGMLHSRFHEAWSLRLGTWLGKGNDPRYTPTTTFETFPFPEGLSPDIPAADHADDPRAAAIAEAARRLVELRERWVNPPELVEWVEEPVAGYPRRLAPRGESAVKELRKRTLTSLYNARPQWLADAHAALDAAGGGRLWVGRGHLRRGGAERIAGAQFRVPTPFAQECTVSAATASAESLTRRGVAVRSGAKSPVKDLPTTLALGRDVAHWPARFVPVEHCSEPRLTYVTMARPYGGRNGEAGRDVRLGRRDRRS